MPPDVAAVLSILGAIAAGVALAALLPRAEPKSMPDLDAEHRVWVEDQIVGGTR